MRKKHVLSLCLLMLSGITAMSLASCSSGNEGDNGATQESITLSSEEQKVYNAVRNSLSSFKDPGSVKVISVSEEVIIGGRYLKISAKNSLGGTVTSMYQVSGSSLRGPITDYSSYSADSSISVSKINSLLSEYKASMGWN